MLVVDLVSHSLLVIGRMLSKSSADSSGSITTAKTDMSNDSIRFALSMSSREAK